VGVDPQMPVSFDLTRDQPDNRIHDASGNITFRLGSLRKDGAGRGIVDLYGDLKRHHMGSGMAEAIDEVGTGASVFLTRNLWGVGSTAPYMHDGRATTLTEAILSHGGESAASRTAFTRLGLNDQKALIAFLDNLVLFKMEEEEVVVPPPASVQMNSTLVRRIRR
jgi:cytochrome c peroxidase